MSDKSNNSDNANELLLARLLENCKKNRIKNIAEQYNVRISEKFTKQQMIDAVLPVIEVNFGVKLKHYSVHDLAICMECLTENEISQETAERIMNSVPFGDGAVYITCKKNEYHASVPHELAGKIMMRCVTNCFLDKVSELERCALASAAIYGCFTPQMLADVAISAYALDLTEKQTEKYLSASSSDVFSYKDGNAYSHSLPSFNIHPQAVDEQYYIPTRGEVESYASYGADSSDYYYRQIVNFIYNNPDITYGRARSLMREIADWCRSDSDFSKILNILTQSDIIFSPDQYNFLLGMMGELYNRTRKPTLKGHRSDEIEGVKPIIIPGVQIAAIKNEPIRVENKIGRNDPCPCGSGKKYKKCCGKNR